jgi:serine/threonine-protein kinase
MTTPRKNVATPRKRSSVIAEAAPDSATRTFTLPFRPGDIIAEKYEVVGALGVGGVAYVISALHLELHEMVALKFLRPESLEHDEVVSRFASEARAVARIKNEHVAHVFDVGWLPESGPYIVMEHLEGKDLADILAERGALSIKDAVDYVLQACEALACAHAAGIVHRDIKPENLFLAQQAASAAVIKVLDFGISKSAVAAQDPTTKRAHTMLPMGTPGYMSPEQIRACGTVDARTDIWALGCVLGELITNRSTFEAPTVMQLSASILERDPIPLRKALPDAPAELEAVILKCLDKRPEGRFEDVAELATALYPFGPRRARLSVERCHQVLRGKNGVVIEFNSVPPPAGGHALTPLPVSSTSAVSVSSSALEPVSTGAPATTTVAVPVGLKPNRSRLVAFGAMGLAVIAGVAFALRSGAPAGTAAGPPLAQPQAAAAAARPVATNPALAPVAAATTAQGRPPATEAPDEADDAEGTPSAKPKKSAKARAAARPARPVAAPPSAKPPAAKRTTLDPSEPDVGY